MPSRVLVRTFVALVTVMAGLFLSSLLPAYGVPLLWATAVATALVAFGNPDWLGRGARQRREEQARILAREAALAERERRLRERDFVLGEREARLREREESYRARERRLHEREQAAWQRPPGPRAWPPREDAADARRRVVMAPHEWLGVPEDASDEEARAAWARLVKLYHPDRVRDLPAWAREDAERRAKAINEAYEAFKARRR